MHPNESLARRELEVLSGDAPDLGEVYTEDSVVHYPGSNPLAGTWPVGDFIDRIRAAIGPDGSFSVELHDALGSDDHAVQLLDVHASAKGRSLSWRAIAVFHVRDGRFSEVWLTLSDQDAVDEFLNAIAG